ncbi:MAG TPA: secretin N-terminal domain-containing protein [Gallionella sp.]|nr:secretin N-terminal domain-containing protein [Gallionella sp.]
MLLLLVAATVAGCAGQKLHREGLALMEQGRTEEGLVKLEQASKADPENLSYRAIWLRKREQTANRLAAAAGSERVSGNLDTAQAIYERVLKIDPENGRAKLGLEELASDRRHAAMVEEARGLIQKGEAEAARNVLKPVLLENPRHGQAVLLQRQIDEQAAKALMVEPTLKPQFRKPITLQFRDANLKMVLEALSRTSGINVLLDKDVKPDIRISIFVKDVSVEDAIDLILLQSQLELKIISDNTVFIYPNTPAKLKDYQDLKIRSFHLTNADPKQMLTMIKTLLKTKDIFVHEKTNSLVMRDTPEAVRLAEKMVADQDIADPEVMLEVEVLEISRSRLSELGIKYPNQIGFTALAAGGAAALPTVNDLRNLNGASIATSPALNVTLNMLLQDGDSNLLASPRIRARNREKAKIMIGDRVPVITNAVTPVTTGSPVITGNVQYLDVGLKLEVEPEVHMDNEVSIKVSMEVSSIVKEVLNAVSGTLAYQVGTRNTSTVLRLKDGETQILAGLINDEDRNTASKVPGIGDLPLVGRLFSSHRDNGSKTEIVLSITPRVVGNHRYPDAREVEYWSGTESNLRSDLLNMKPTSAVMVGPAGAASPAIPAVRPQPAAVNPAAVNPAAAGSPVAAGNPVASAQPQAFSWQGPSQAKVGDRISLTLNAPAQQGASGLGFLVGFDPTVLKAADVTEGNWLKRGDVPPVFSKSIDQASGQIRVDMKGTSAGDSGSVVTLMFEVTAPTAQSPVMVSGVNLSGSGGETLALAAPAPHFIAVTQ